MASAPNAAELVSTITNQMTERPAIRPARAWSAPDTTPVTSKAMISGMTVIFSASSHSPPTVDATVISGCRMPSPAWLDRAPSSRPMTSAPSTSQVARLPPVFIAASGT